MNLLFTVIGGKFKFQVQDSFLEYFFWRFEKQIALSEKKPPLKLESAAKIILETETNLWILDGRKPQRIIEAVTKMKTIGTHILKSEEEAEQSK